MVDVVSGELTERELVLAPATVVQLASVLPQSQVVPPSGRLVIRSGDGEQVAIGFVTRRQGKLIGRFPLPRGRFRIECHTENGLHGEITLDVSGEPQQDAVIQLQH
jgi:hypothetical protein